MLAFRVIPPLALCVIAGFGIFGGSARATTTSITADIRVYDERPAHMFFSGRPVAFPSEHRGTGAQPLRLATDTFVVNARSGVAAKSADDVLELAARDSWGNPKTLADHFQRHGSDFGSRSADEYAQQASKFLQRGVKGGAQIKVDSRGVIRVYDPKTNTFGAYNPNGTTRAFYKPDPRVHGYRTNQAYFNAQPGRAP